MNYEYRKDVVVVSHRLEYVSHTVRYKVMHRMCNISLKTNYEEVVILLVINYFGSK